MAGVERRLQRILGQGYGLCCAFAMAKAVISLMLFVLETKVMDGPGLRVALTARGLCLLPNRVCEGPSALKA